MSFNEKLINRLQNDPQFAIDSLQKALDFSKAEFLYVLSTVIEAYTSEVNHESISDAASLNPSSTIASPRAK